MCSPASSRTLIPPRPASRFTPSRDPAPAPQKKSDSPAPAPSHRNVHAGSRGIPWDAVSRVPRGAGLTAQGSTADSI